MPELAASDTQAAPGTVNTPPAPSAGNSWHEALIEISLAAAAVANYCDHLEHCEPAERAWVSEAAARLRGVGVMLAQAYGCDLKKIYATRLRAVEARHPLAPLHGFDGGEHVDRATTWRDLQLVQGQHDRLYHPDVVGLHKQDQLRHCALHVAKLAGAAARGEIDSSTRDDFCARRLPDLLLFGLKLATLIGERLPESPLVEPLAPSSSDEARSVLRRP